MTKKARIGDKQALLALETTVRDAKTGRVLPLRGYGALRGQYAIRRDIDLTKPISEQVARLDCAGEAECTPERQASSES